MPHGANQARTVDASPLLSRSFVICAVLFVVAGFGFVLGARRILSEDRFDQKCYESIGRLEESRASVRSVVSNMRGFMLNADPIHQQAGMADLDDARDDLT